MARHDPDLALAGLMIPGQFGPINGSPCRSGTLHFHHVEAGIPSVMQTTTGIRIGRFHNRVGGKGGRDIYHRSVRSRIVHRIGHSIKNGNAFVSGAALAGSYATNNIGPVLDHLLRMERAFFAGDALDDEASRFINKNAQDNCSLGFRFLGQNVAAV